MTAGRYAAGTDVPADRSKAQIEQVLVNYGADQFMYGWAGETAVAPEGSAVVQFRAHGRLIRFVMPMPSRHDPAFTLTETGRARSDTAAYKAWEQATRQRWRALLLAIKAKHWGLAMADQTTTDGLRQVAIEAAKAALLAEQWDHSNPSWAHSNHRYHAFCPICTGDLDRILSVALDAADKALANSSPERDLLDALGLLKVTTDGPGLLTVDGEALICCHQCTRHWRLIETPRGKWRHPESGEEDRLLLVLRSIAQHYLDHRCPHDRQEARR